MFYNFGGFISVATAVLAAAITANGRLDVRASEGKVNLRWWEETS